VKKSIPEIEVKFQKKTYTSRAGLKLITRFTKWFGMRELVETHLYLPKEARKYSSADLICAHLAMRCAGLQRISQSTEIGNDPLVLELAGVSEFPSEDTLYDTLHRFAPGEDMHDEGGIRRLCSLWDLQEACVGRFFEKAEGWRRKARRSVTIDFDSHVQVVYGEQQGARRGYNPKKRGRVSYHPLVATLTEIRMPMAGLFRPGDTNGRTEILTVVEMALEALSRNRIKPALIQARGDAGIVCDQVLVKLEVQGNIRYAFALPISKAFQGRLGGLKYGEISPGIEVAEFCYGGAGTQWSCERRIVVERQSLAERGDKAQGKLFDSLPGYRYQLIVTNKRCSAEQVWRFYNGRADSENVIKDLVEGVGLDAIPTGKFLANAAHFWLMLIAQTVLSAYRTLVVKPITGTIPMVRTLWRRFLYWGGQIVRYSRKVMLCLSRGSPEARKFQALWDQMDALGIT